MCAREVWGQVCISRHRSRKHVKEKTERNKEPKTLKKNRKYQKWGQTGTESR